MKTPVEGSHNGCKIMLSFLGGGWGSQPFSGRSFQTSRGYHLVEYHFGHPGDPECLFGNGKLV